MTDDTVRIIVINPRSWPSKLQDRNSDWIKRVKDGKSQADDLLATHEARRLQKIREREKQNGR